MASEAKMKSSMNIIKAVIKGLIISNPHQMSVYELMEDYKRSEGCALPYGSYGFKSAEEFLKSLPDVVELYGHGVTAVVRPVTNEKTKHIQELVQQQKHDKPKRFPKEKTLAAANTINNNIQRSHGHGMTRNHNRQSQNRQQQAHGKQNNHTTRNQQTAKNIRHFYKTENNPNNRQFGKNMTNINESHVRKSVSESSKSVCSNNSDVTTIKVQNHLSKSFATQHNDRQNSHSNSFTKQHEYKTHNLSADRQSSHSNSFTKQRDYKNNDFQNTPSNSFSKHREYHQHDDRLDLDFQLSHLAPRHLHPKNPIPKFDEPDYMESPNNYSKVPNGDDSPENLFNNLSLNPNIPDVFKGSPKRVTRPDDFDDAVPEFAATSRVFEIDFPNNVMKSTDRIPAYTIPAHFEVGSVFKIYVTEVHNPYKFWFQLSDDDEEITSLMNSLDQKYTRTDDDFIIPVKCLKLGLVCAAKYEGDWHRAEIVGYVKGFKVKCYFVDFGTVADARISDIKYLYKEFGMMPKQALRGSLACIQPLNDVRFTRAATLHFLSRVRGEKLHAQIREIDKNRVLHLVLCNTSGPNVIQLNHDLIEKHYARFDENWNASKRLQGQRIRHPREDYPTFDMLESGEYPSLNELAYLRNLGIDYEGFFDNYLSKLGDIDKGEVDPTSLAMPFGLPLGLLSNNPFAKDILQEEGSK